MKGGENSKVLNINGARGNKFISKFAPHIIPYIGTI
jgi:hypothetical protein